MGFPKTHPPLHSKETLRKSKAIIEAEKESSEEKATDANDRDEVQEVRRVAKKETSNVRLWRFAMIVALLITAVAVTLTTYEFQKREQYESFKTAFEQFSRTLADAAVEQQHRIHDSVRTLSNTVSISATSINATWPFLVVPGYGQHSIDTLRQSGGEVVTLFMIVSHENKQAWIDYANQNYLTMAKEIYPKGTNVSAIPSESYHPYISAKKPEGFIPAVDRVQYYVGWHYFPPRNDFGSINWDIGPINNELFSAQRELKSDALYSRVKPIIAIDPVAHAKMHTKLDNGHAEHPHSFLYQPVYENVGDYDSPIVAVIGFVTAWDKSMRNLLPGGVTGIHAVIKNNCNQSYTYNIQGPDAYFLGDGDHHETTYDDMEVVVDLVDVAMYNNPKATTTPGHCQYSMHIYPSSAFEKSYDSIIPELFALVVASTFVMVAVVFYIYDNFVQTRNEKLIASAAQSNAIVTSLFPSNIRDRLIEQNSENRMTQSVQKHRGFVNNRNMAVPTGSATPSLGSSNTTALAKPIADLFLDATVMFADICGFTAWSSVREPFQVFTLLETLFQSFDKIAKNSRVFKVETVGDCYVAAAGIPEPIKNHAIVMIKYSRSILDKMNVLSKELELTLGPDTGDLGLRIGINSGPVTAGVLRGERSRFQLFGDTVNTASRIEATGIAGRVHVSQETADRIVSAGKGNWLEKRAEAVKAKGKGDIQTYFIGSGFDRRERGSAYSEESSGMKNARARMSKRYEERMKETGLGESSLRLVDWNVEMLLVILKQIVVRRKAKQERKKQAKERPKPIRNRITSSDSALESNSFLSFPLDEVCEIIRLPEFDREVAHHHKDPDTIEIPHLVATQLREYVTCVAGMYNDNAFHNFEHASHVTMSVIKLLSRIIAPTDLDVQIDPAHSNDAEKAAATLHDHTYGITSDPLTQFACAFSALIHDTDHFGVPNSQLVKEGVHIASLYKNRSVAEQNSLVLAWELLMDKRFDDFRSCLCANDSELLRFRQLVVNSVMATDIVDKELKNLRNSRWEAAFKCQGDLAVDEKPRDAINRKATIVIEHLIQASDVAHTMQHWHVYRKWNERFFRECYAAYKAGRAEKDPSEGWYKGEIGFFDFYIIPLAKKLKNCGVFGKSSDEYLTYALSNRDEWEARGQEMVKEMMDTIAREESERQTDHRSFSIETICEDDSSYDS